MFIKHDDIRSQIAEPPKWWLNGVPRYCDFSPDECGIYQKEALLVKAACQACHTVYLLGIAGSGRADTFKDQIDLFGMLNLGDPPNACCWEGSTMQALGLEVLEYWERNIAAGDDWVRVSEYENWLEEALHHGVAEWAEAFNASGATKPLCRGYQEPDWSPILDYGNFTELKLLFTRAGSNRAEALASNYIDRRDRGRREHLARNLAPFELRVARLWVLSRQKFVRFCRKLRPT